MFNLNGEKNILIRNHMQQRKVKIISDQSARSRKLLIVFFFSFVQKNKKR